MLSANDQAASSKPLDFGQRCLPQMTIFFVDGLSKHKAKTNKPKKNSNLEQWSNVKLRRFKVPLLSDERIKTNDVKSFCKRIEQPISRSRKGKSVEEEIMRHFICGISNSFNNILMGIWGNISLISMSIDSNHKVMNQIDNIDRLIQNGSLLINSLFGYLAERRVATRHLRLVQLVQEINERIHNPEFAINLQEIEKSMELAFQETRPAKVAGGMAYILDHFLKWMDSELQLALWESSKEVGLQKRLKTIDRVLKRGFDFVEQLEIYAGAKKLVFRKINIKKLVLQMVKRLQKRHGHLEIAVEVSDTLRPVKAARKHLQYVIEQLLINGAGAMPDGGKIHVSVRSINEETPEERCVVDRACDYVVITVSDNGKGMSTQNQAKIFLPFFNGHCKSNPEGLGLAASSSIVKSHGGYIQVRSEKEKGSTFKIYLP